MHARTRIAVFSLLCAMGVVVGGCATGVARKADDEARRYVDYAGAPVQEFHAWRMDGWTPVSRNELVVWVGVNEAYLLKVWDTCPDLEFSNVVGITEWMHTVNLFEKVKVGRDTCPIREIRPIDIKRMKADAKAAKAEADRKETPKQP
ncbi:MAG: hypothetical protein RL603_1135 [Pseudomonadota bacterium]